MLVLSLITSSMMLIVGLKQSKKAETKILMLKKWIIIDR